LSALVLNAGGVVDEDLRDVCGLLQARGAAVHVASPSGDSALPWSSGVPEVLAPILAIVRAQQLSLALSTMLGQDPDAPFGLSKVTRT
jgi:glucosamine--fructose-6-phosphate aminotransferase (isomerizing)